MKEKLIEMLKNIDDIRKICLAFIDEGAMYCGARCEKCPFNEDNFLQLIQELEEE